MNSTSDNLKGFDRGDPTQLCCKVKEIYGLKQASGWWYMALINALSEAKVER